MQNDIVNGEGKTSEVKKQKNIELIYALPNEQKIITIQVHEDCNVEQAIRQSGILELYPELNLNTTKIGIFSNICQLSDKLHEGDRIEFYRPLIIDPKEARKNRALKQN